MTTHTEKRLLMYRGEQFEVDYTYLLDDTGAQFITPEMGDANLAQVYDQYNKKYGTNVKPD